jgi:hypothetical protein
MKRTAFRTLTVILGTAALLSAIPAAAQIDNAVTFDAPFAFYAGNAKMPAGSYRVTQPDITSPLLQVESADGSHSAFVEFLPVVSPSVAPKSEVTFKKYGNADFLSGISLQGQEFGMQIPTSKAEENAAKAAAAVNHTLTAKNGR